MPPGTVLARQGMRGDALLVLLDGTAQAVTPRPGGPPAEAMLAPGASIGARTLFLDTPYEATVTALGPATVLRLPRAALRRVVARYAPAERALRVFHHRTFDRSAEALHVH